MSGSVKTEGFEGKPKGAAQILFESGWWHPSGKMVGSMPRVCKVTGKRFDNGKPLPEETMVVDLVLGKRPDFLNELSELAKVIHARGHILQMSPKCHPELAGHGIEYAWGAAKLRFRRDNDGSSGSANFFKRVRAALASVSLSLALKFERRARAYRRALKDPANDSYKLLEKTMKKFKSHRDAGDFDGRFIRNEVASDGQ